MLKILTPLFLGAAIIATAPAAATPRDTSEVQLKKLLEGRVAGEPVDCINLSGSQSSTIIDGKAIVYRSGAKLYVNEPQSGARSLRDDTILVTKTFGSQLCRLDVVQLIDRGGYFPRGPVFLGKFVPYTKPKQAR